MRGTIVSLLLILVISCFTYPALADNAPASLTVHIDQIKHPISPTLHGIFFEDINFAADGGIYPERVKNGSFEFSPDPLMGWHRMDPPGNTVQVSIGTDQPLNASNPHYLTLTLDQNDPAGHGLTNDGFRGMGVLKEARYIFSVYARVKGPTAMNLTTQLIGTDNQDLGEAKISATGQDWKKYSAEIQAAATDAHAHLLLTTTTAGSIDLDMVSILPVDTFNHHPNGLRPDLVQLLKDLHPKFVRFPGGCIVEGRTLDNRYQWKNTIGDLSQRKLNLNRWNTEFNHRPTPDYFQSYGLGFFEFFQLCEDIGAAPLPILNCGMACQYNTGELAPMPQIDSYAQDAIDLVEFANGPVDSTWGKKRADMGHPAPFHLTRIGIGNEQWGPRYIERYAQITQAIKAKYPEMEFVAAAGPSPDGPLFHFAWDQLSALHADIMDEHYYANPDWFISNTARYDHYPRTGPKVFAGEFAAQSVNTGSPDNRNNWRCALAEAAFMTGLERNSDLVVMSSYAPLFAHVDAWQWTPNLIWFDNLHCFGTPSYCVQQLFGANTGTALLAADVAGDSNGLFTTASRDDQSGDLIIKAVNVSAQPRQLKIEMPGLSAAATAHQEVLSSDDLEVVNSLNHPKAIWPKQSDLGSVGSSFVANVPGSALVVFRVHQPT